MKYTNLKKDIVNILHSDEYDLYLKFYNEDGNTTLDPNEADWCYIHNYNIMIKFMDDNNPILLIMKDNSKLNDYFKNIVQRLREFCILNGVSVQLKTYDNLNQKKLYTFIKNNIIQKKQEKNMNESYDRNILVETFYNMLNTSKNTKRKSDFYLSEDIHTSISQSLLLEMIQELNSYYNFKDLNISSLLQDILICKNLNEVKSFVNSLENNTANRLIENVDIIENIIKFVKNEYINNISFNPNKPKSIMVLENVKVYPIKQLNKKENLINAYNELINESDNIKSDTDIIRIIRNKNICENYNVSRSDLLNMWLENNTKKIEPKRAFVFETTSGEKIVFNDIVKNALIPLSEHINNNGDKDDSISKEIINESIKYNHILSFLNEHHNSFSLKELNIRFKKMLKESSQKLKSKDLSNFYSENIDYQNEFEILCETVGFFHPALKYIAIQNAKENLIYSKILFENNINDLNLLTKELKPFTKSLSELQNLVETIMKKEIKINGQLNESLDRKNIVNKCSEIYKELCFENDNNKSKIASALFNIIHTKYRLNENKIKFIQTLIKYII